MDTEDSIFCFTCKLSSTSSDSFFIFCDICNYWFHGSCVGLCNDEISNHISSQPEWSCPSCVSSDTSQHNVTSEPALLSCPSCDGKFFKGIKGLRIHWSRAHPDHPFENVAESPEVNLSTFLNSNLSFCKTHVRVMKRIPKSARYCAADKLNEILGNCI